MSDLAPESVPVETAPVEAETAPVVETPVGDPFDNPDTTTFPREYVERLRAEAAERRTALNPFKEAFDGYADEEVQTLLGLVHTLSTDPETAAAQMEQIVQAIREQSTTEEPVPEFLTREQLDSHLAEREHQRSVDEATALIEKTATDLGYKPNTPSYIELLWRAQNETNFDLQKAHDAIRADRQAEIDAYVEAKRKDADGNPSILGPVGGPASEHQVPKDFKSAREALEARLNGTAGN